MASGGISAVIVGVGKVGSRFDEEPERGRVWSHTGAYLACPHLFRLAGVCEPGRVNATAFRTRCPDIPVYSDVEALIAEQDPQVVSICTPTESHAATLAAALNSSKLQVVWCEKPLARTVDDATRMVEACAGRGVQLLVSYVRRWTPLWRRARAIVDSQALGRLHLVRVAMPNRLWSIGSHAIDLLQFLGGPIGATAPFAIPELEQDNEPAVAGQLRLRSGGYGIVQVTGLKHNYVVEAEVIGEQGRMTVREDQECLVIERFEPSRRYAGYRELGPPTIERLTSPPQASPFIAIAEEIAALACGGIASPTCDGAAALDVQRVLAGMAGGR